jgi:hypothetical protein
MLKLKTNKNFSKPQLAIFVVVFALIGILIYKSFAANPGLPGDLNNDNTVNIQDLSILLSDYGTSNTAADINGDGTVDILDMSLLLSHYGQTVASFSTSLTEGMTIKTPYTWTFDPGVATTAGYFYADGVQLAKVTGPGPYSFNMTASTLTAGAHKLGGSWDLADGTHVVFPQAYDVTIDNGTTSGGGGGTSGGPGTGYSGPWRDTSYTVPTSFTKVITSASAFQTLVSPSGSLAPGDVVHVVGPMTIDGKAGGHTTINKFLSSPASIYFDSNVVFAGDTNNNVVGWNAVYIDGANINLYGGTVAGGLGSGGIKVGPGYSTDTQTVKKIKWWGVKIHDVGGTGLYVGGGRNGAGTFVGTDNIDFDAEVWNVGLNYATDPHAVKGTGLHALYIGGSDDPPGGVSVNHSKFSVYTHDTSKCAGDAQVGPATQNTEFWVRANNLSFYNTTSGWTAARAFTPWTAGANSYTDANITVHDVEGHNLTGPVVFTESLGSGPVTVEYGRAVNVLTWSTANSYFGANPYQPNSHVTYQNVQ